MTGPGAGGTNSPSRPDRRAMGTLTPQRVNGDGTRSLPGADGPLHTADGVAGVAGVAGGDGVAGVHDDAGERIHPGPRPGPPTSPLAVVLRTVQVVALVVTALALLPQVSLSAGAVLIWTAPLVMASTAALFVITAVRDRRYRGPAAAWVMLALALLALTGMVDAWWGTHQARPGWPQAVIGVSARALELAAIWLLLRGRAPRWAPSTGWDGSVVALGASALGVGAFECAVTLRRPGAPFDLACTAPALAQTALFVGVLTALAIAAPSPRPQLRWLAAGLTLVSVADLGALTYSGTTSLLARVEPHGPNATDVHLLALLALGGYAVIGLAGSERPPDGRGRGRPARLGGSLAGALVLVCIVLLVAVIVDPQGPRVAAALALACLGLALARTRQSLHEMQQLGSADPRPRTDDLTGLANRRALSEALAGETHSGDGDDWTGWAGWSDEIALLLVDLDRFKEVNEALGHGAGDRLLATVGARLRSALRPAQLLARLGGDEFAVVLPAAGADQGRRVALALRAALREPVDIDGQRLHVSASVGVATCHPSRGEPTDLLRQADVAMYHAKAAGTGVELYDPQWDEGGPARLRRTDELREALERGDLEVHIQPQVDLRAGTIIGAEALARWRHPVDGVLLPDSFLPLAEHTGLMRPVAALVLNRALEACSQWWTLGHHVPVSVNLGADDLRDPDLPGRVTEVLRAQGLPPAALRVEITEQSLLTDPAAAATVLARWRADGIAVAIDDFGTGYSSLSYLRELPIDEVKLDKAFVADIRRPTTTTIVRHTVAMAHGLWARVVAEGIEDEATARILTDLGADVGQGNYFGAAMTTPEFLARLSGQAT